MSASWFICIPWTVTAISASAVPENVSAVRRVATELLVAAVVTRAEPTPDASGDGGRADSGIQPCVQCGVESERCDVAFVDSPGGDDLPVGPTIFDITYSPATATSIFWLFW